MIAWRPILQVPVFRVVVDLFKALVVADLAAVFGLSDSLRLSH